MTHIDKHYGLVPMSLDEELKAEACVRKTRNNKVQIIDDCDAIIKLVETIRYRALSCPELNDVAHAQIVEKFAEIVKSAKKKVDEAVMFGYN